MFRPSPLDQLVRASGGIAPRQQILDAGYSPNAIAWAVGHGRLVRVRRAWYAVPDADGDRVSAVMLGGRLGAFSAAASYGIWRGLDRDLHVSWKPHGNVAKPGRARFDFPDSRVLPSGRSVRSHWRLDGFEESSDAWRESVPQTLAQILLVADQTTALCSCDSALNKRLLGTFESFELFEKLPRRLRRLRSLLDGRADSGLETIVRLWLWSLGLDVRTQVMIDGRAVDILVGKSLVIETDGREWHSDEERFTSDRKRTAELQARGYTVIKLSYQMIMFNWQLVEAVVREALRSGRHLDTVR
jgi:very-short-patch-repair endonuclease